MGKLMMASRYVPTVSFRRFILSSEAVMVDYVIQISTPQEFTDWELDELRQVVLDWMTPDEETVIIVTESD
jgi:hypothetical protein